MRCWMTATMTGWPAARPSRMNGTVPARNSSSPFHRKASCRYPSWGPAGLPDGGPSSLVLVLGSPSAGAAVALLAIPWTPPSDSVHPVLRSPVSGAVAQLGHDTASGTDKGAECRQPG